MAASTASVGESDGTKDLTVSLSAASGRDVTVPYTVSSASGDTATASDDYTEESSGSLSITAGDTSGTITVTIASDTIDEPDETLTVTLGTPTNAALGSTAKTVVTITDDDSEPTLSINSPSVTEGASGSSATLTFKVTLSTASGKEVTVNYADAGTGTATSGTDYAAITSGTLTFSAGDTSKDVAVTVNGDALNEPNETVVVTISSATNASISTATGTGTITDDDGATLPVASMAASTASVSEGAGSATIAVRLDSAADQNVTVGYTVSSESTDTAEVDDYTEVSSGSLAISAGDTSTDITVAITPDSVDEDDETFTVALSNPVGATLGTIAKTVVTITDDDAAGIKVNLPENAATTEENAGTVEFTVALSSRPDDSVTVTVTSSDETEGTVSPETLTFEADNDNGRIWSAGQTVTVTGRDDEEADGDVGYSVQLAPSSSDANYGNLEPVDISLVNIDDDLSILSLEGGGDIPEGGSGDAVETAFVVTLDPARNHEVTVDYATADGTAAAGDDYVETSGTLVFSPGETAKTVSVTVNGDDEVEADETFALSLSNPSNGQIDPQNAEAETVILNDDEAVVSAEACGEAFPSGTTTVRISCSSGLPEIDLKIILPARLTRNGDPIEKVTVTLAPSGQEIHGGLFGFTGDSDHHSLVDIDISPIPDGDVTVGLPVTSHLREHAGEQRLFLIRHSDGTWEELESSPRDHRIHADVNGFSPFAVAYEIDAVRRRLGNVNRTILPELSRAATSSVLDAVARRIEDVMSGGAEGGFTAPIPEASGVYEPGPRLGELEYDRPLSFPEAVDGSYFSVSPVGSRGPAAGAADPAFGELAGATAPRPYGLGVWVSGDYRSLSGAGSSVDWSGSLFAGHLGADYRFGSRLVAGVAASWFEGSFDYTETDAESYVSGDYGTRMNAFHPYLGVSLSPRLDVWAAAGWGFGEIKIDDGELSGRQKGGVRLATAAAGANVRLFADGTSAVSLRTETWLSRVRVKNNGERIEGLAVKTDRLRAVLRGSHALFFGSGASLVPSVELGLRRDGGDGEAGTGAELGTGVGYVSPALGLAVEVRGRTLLAHEGSTREWGVGGSVRFDPGDDGRGIFLNAVPSYGESLSGVERLWDSETAVSAATGYGRALSFETEIGYGFAAFGGRGLFTPYGAFGRHGSEGGSYRAGSRFNLGYSFDVSLEGQRQEFEGGEPEHGVLLTGSVSW